MVILLRPFIKIKFGYIITSRIGHLCYNVDNYLSYKKLNYSKEIAIFNYDKSIANKILFSTFKKKKNLFFSKIASFPIRFIEWLHKDYYTDFQKNKIGPSYPFLFNFLISHQKILHPRITNYSVMPANIDTNNFSLNNNKIQLKTIKKNNFVCFHNRDSAYEVRNDSNFHDFRNFEFDDYRDAIKSLNDLNVPSVRIGKKIEKKSLINSKLFFDLTGDRSSDLIDLSLINESLFFVGTNSGISNVARIFRKPEVLVNYIPFKLEDLSAWAKNSLFIVKKLFLKKENRFLKFYEMNDIQYDIHYKGNYFFDLGLDVINNSKEEIKEAVSEMYYRRLGLWKDTPLQKDLQEKFWNSIENSSDKFIIKNELKTIIGSKFLEKNSHLI